MDRRLFLRSVAAGPCVALSLVHDMEPDWKVKFRETGVIANEAILLKEPINICDTKALSVLIDNCTFLMDDEFKAFGMFCLNPVDERRYVPMLMRNCHVYSSKAAQNRAKRLAAEMYS